MITEDIEESINQVLRTIDENPDVLLDKNTRFFGSVEESKAANVSKDEKHKPIYLKDYHRLQLLAKGKDGYNSDSEEEEYPEGEKPYAIQQKEDKAKILAEINKAVEDGDDQNDEDDDSEYEGFFTKRDEQRTVETIALPDPQNDAGKFLEAYLEKKAWLPRTVDKKTGEIIMPTYEDLVEDDEEFDDNAETYENAYNMRFEDPNANEILSYARTQNTIRREKASSRKRKRDAKKDALRQEEEKQEAELQHLKNKKATQIMKKMSSLQKQLQDDPDAEELAKIFDDEYLDGDFEGDEWDKKMSKIFGEEFYAQDAELPEDADDDNEQVGGAADYDAEEGEEGAEGADDAEYDEDEDFNMDADLDASTAGKSKNQLKKEERQRKQEEQKKLQEAAQRVVEENVELLIKEEGSKSLKKTLEKPKFKYRDVSPDSFGLTARDILLAEDKDLNRFIGIKKLATYRDEDKKEKDRKKFGKKKRVKEWRMSVFNSKESPDDELVEKIWAEKQKGNKRSGSDKPKRKKQKVHKE